MNPAKKIPNGKTHCNWISVKDALPPKDGLYLVDAKSADSCAPLMALAWWNLSLKKWEMLHKIWCDAITYWAYKPDSPNKKKEVPR